MTTLDTMAPTANNANATTTKKKRVRWSTITIHEFAVAHGGSAVPKSGPSIGLARTPEFTWSTSVGTMASECDGVRRFSAAERTALLKAAGFSRDRIEAFVDEADDVRMSRELYNSSEMKAFRKKRKKSKADAKAKRRHVAVDAATSVKTATAPSECSQDQGTTSLRIQIRPVPAVVVPSMPLSPCCS